MNPIHFFTLGYYPEYLFIGIIWGIIIGFYTHFRVKYALNNSKLTVEVLQNSINEIDCNREKYINGIKKIVESFGIYFIRILIKLFSYFQKLEDIKQENFDQLNNYFDRFLIIR